MDYTEEQLMAELEKYGDWIEQFDGVSTTGVGIGRQHPLCIKVYGDEISPKTKQRITNRLKSLPVEFEREIRGIAY